MIVNYDRKTFIVQATGACTIKCFMIVIISMPQLAIVFGTTSYFCPSQKYAGKAWSQPLQWNPIRVLM